jgi:hypothetical protein
MESSIKGEKCKSNERKRKLDSTGRDLRRWQRKRATIESLNEERFGVPKTDSDVEPGIHNLKR